MCSAVLSKEQGAAKKHLDTREFKQQREAVDNLQQEAQAVSAELERKQREESDLQERLQSIQQQAQEAEQTLSEQTELPQASMFNYKPALEKAYSRIENQKKALAVKGIIKAQNEKQQVEIQGLRETVNALNQKMLQQEAERAEEQKKSRNDMRSLRDTNENLFARLEQTEKFFRWNSAANQMRDDYEREQREEARRIAEERKRLAQEIEQQERQRQEEQQRREIELAREKEAQQLEREREREQQKAQSLERRPRGMGMGR